MSSGLVKGTDSILTQVCKPVDFNNIETDPYILVEIMQAMRVEGGGVGLAAPQLGWDMRLIVIGSPNKAPSASSEDSEEGESERDTEFDQCFFNPEITEYSDKEVYMIEGCLTFPELYIKVKRPDWIELKWETEEGSEVTEKCGGMTARVLQHEVDHLNGILYQTRANRFHLEKARKEVEKMKRLRKKNAGSN